MEDMDSKVERDDAEKFQYFEDRMWDSKEEKGQIQFLKDQVRRLTALVREYQMKYMPINENNIEDLPLAPWMTDMKVLSPLLVEYDNSIRSLKEQIKYYKEQFDKLQETSRDVVEENKRLHQELRRTVENQLDFIEQSGGLSNESNIQLKQLQDKLNMIISEKERVDKLYQEAVKDAKSFQADLRSKLQVISSLSSENARLQDDTHQARLFAESLQKGSQKLKAEYEQFLKTAHMQDLESDELKSQIRKLTGEVKTCKSLNAELQSHNNRLKEQFKNIDKDAMKDTITEKSAEGTIRKLQNEIIELDSRVLLYSKELEKVRLERADLEEQLSTLQKKNTAIEENEYQAILRVRDSVQLVENALLEREQAVIREQQKSQEVSRLQEAINTLLKEGEEKRKKVGSSMKAQYEKQIHQLMEDLHYHEIEGAEKQAAYDKLRREKLSIQNQLEKIYQEGPVEVTKAGLSLDELHKKLSKVELNRDECLLQNDIIQMTLRRYKSRLENDKAIYLNQLNELRKQTKMLKEDFDEVSESRLKLLDEVNILKKELQTKNDDNVSRDMSCVSQVSSLQQKLEIKEKEYESRLVASESTNKEAMNELRGMLAVQQKSANKWREESRCLSQKLESKIGELSRENDILKRKNEELAHLHNQNRQKIEDMEKETHSNQSTIDKLKMLYSESEERAENTNEQLQMQAIREKQLLKDRQSLNQQIDKLKLELSRPGMMHTTEQQWDNYLEGYSKNIS